MSIQDEFEQDVINIEHKEEECIYSDFGRDSLVDDDAISSAEEAFMRGYSEEDEIEELCDED